MKFCKFYFTFHAERSLNFPFTSLLFWTQFFFLTLQISFPFFLFLSRTVLSLTILSLRVQHSHFCFLLQVVSRYAIHNSSVGFCLKKQGESGVDLRTPPNSTARDNIRIVFGSTIAKELLEVSDPVVTSFLYWRYFGWIIKMMFSHSKYHEKLYIENFLIVNLSINHKRF